MAKIAVQFRFLTGLRRRIFNNARLRGSWDDQGKYSNVWNETPMTEIKAEDGCPAFTATVQFESSEVGKHFRWGVVLDSPQATNQWGIPTEIQSADSTERVREFVLQPGPSEKQDFYFTYARRLGARKYFKPGG